MMRRLVAAFAALLGAYLSPGHVHAQPATLPASVTARPAPASTVTPASASVAETPIQRFQPLEAYPPATQGAFHASLAGASWLARMNQPHGRFLYGYLTALRQNMEGDDDLAQAQAALALAHAARFTGEARHRAVAGQAILTLLAATRVDPANPARREPVPTTPRCNRPAFAAVLSLAIRTLPQPGDTLLAEAERLCEYLHGQLQKDGSTGDSAESLAAAGVMFQALAASQAAQPATWKAAALTNALTHYRKRFREQPDVTLAATLTPAFCEWYRQTRSADVAAFVFEMNDWLGGLQYASTETRRPLWMGGFRTAVKGQPVDTPPGFESAVVVRSLACACRLTRQVPDVSRFEKYRFQLRDGLTFLDGLQFREENTRHFENNYRAGLLIGGFMLSPTDGNLRLDATALCVQALLEFLHSGAEKG